MGGHAIDSQRGRGVLGEEVWELVGVLSVGVKRELVSDDLVPLMIMTLIQSSLTDLLSTVDYITEFDFTQLKERELGYPSFFIPSSQILFFLLSSCHRVSSRQSKGARVAFSKCFHHTTSRSSQLTHGTLSAFPAISAVAQRRELRRNTTE